MPDTPTYSIVAASDRDGSWTEAARLEAIKIAARKAQYGQPLDGHAVSPPHMLEELRKLGWELVRRG